MRHDQLSKMLIETFFPDFFRLILPDAAPHLRLGEATFLDKELYTDWPTGRRRELDLLARVPVEGEEVHLLIHVEIETRARTGMDQRLWRYNMQIRLRHDLRVVPILVNLRGGRPGLGPEVLEDGFKFLPTTVFRYQILGLSGCRAAEWLPRPEPVAWALAALMQPGTWSQAELKLECLRRVQQGGVTGFRKEVLVNWIESYVQLSGEDAAEYQRLLAQEKNKEIRQMQLTWLGKAEAQGRMQGKAEGKAEGKAQGKAEAVEQMRRMVLQRIEKRFGVVPEAVQVKVQAMNSLKALVSLVEKLPLAPSAEDLLSRRRSRSKISVS
jgi:hypothetical protein